MTALTTYSANFKVFDGTTDVSTGHGVVYSVVSEVGCDASINASTGVYTLSSVTSDTAYAILRAVYNGVTIDKRFSVAKSRAGSSGAAAKLMWITTTRQTVSYDSNGTTINPATQDIVLTAYKQNTTAAVTWTATDANGVAVGSPQTGDTFTILSSVLASLFNGTTSFKIKGTITDGTTIEDYISVAKVTAGAVGAPGADGLNNAPILIYQRAASAPALPSATTTYTFATKALTGLNNGWTTTIPAGSNPLYVSAATASSSTGADTIASNEWAAATVLVQDGAAGGPGADGIKHASVTLYQRTSTTTPPAAPSSTLTYTFSTAALSGTLGSWTQSLPTSGGSYRWKTTATALSTGSTDTIASGEWAGVALLAQDGLNSTVGYLTNEAHTVPADSAGTVSSFTGTGGTFKVFNGATDVTTSSSFFVASSSGLSISITPTTGVYSITAMSASTGTAILSAVYNGITISKDYVISKAIAGATGGVGAASKTLSVICDRQLIHYDAAGSPSPSTQTTTFTTNKQNTTGTVTWTITDMAGVARTPITSFLSAATGDSVTMTEAQFASARNGTSGVIVSGSITDGTTFSDKISIVRTQTGQTGNPGPAIVITPSTGVVTFIDGVASPASQTVTLTATLQNVSGTINWSTSPAASPATGIGTTFTLDQADFATNKSIVVTATVGPVTQSISITRQDALSTEYLGTISDSRTDLLDAGGTFLSAYADGVYSRSEKKKVLLPLWTKIQDEYTKLNAEAATVASVASLRTAMTNAYNTLSSYITSVSFTTDKAQTAPDLLSYINAYQAAAKALDTGLLNAAKTTAVYTSVTGTPTSLGAINSTEGAKLGGIAPNAGVVLDLYFPHALTPPSPTIKGNSVSAPGGAWNHYCSREAITGPCSVTFTFDGQGLQTCGLVSYIAGPTQDYVEMTLYQSAPGQVTLWVGGYFLEWAFTTNAPGDVFTLRVDNVNFIIEKNGVVIRTHSLASIGRSPNQSLRVGGSIYGGTIGNIKFGPANDARFDASKMGALAPENNATVGAKTGINLKQDDGAVLTQAKVRNTDLVIAGSAGALYLTHTGNVAIDNVNLSDAGIAALAYKSAASLDSDVTDGATYARPLASRLSGGKPLIDFSEGIHANKNVDWIADGATYARPLTTELTGGVHKLGIAGSGKKLGDARQIPNVTAMNLSYKWPTAPTYSSASTSATISVPATTLISGSVNVTYNAMSVGVTGSPGTIVPYYLYIDDPTNAGGSRTLAATTDGATIYQSDGRVYVGAIHVSFPSSGTDGGTGDGGGGNCVAADAWVETFDRGYVPAREVQPGDSIRVLADDMESTLWELVTSNMLAPARGWLLTSASGILLTLSDTTPITLRDRSMIRVDEIDGHELPVQCAKGFRWEPCQAEPVGGVMVAHIRVSQKTYAAGDVPGRSILTHNPFNGPKP